MYTSNMSNRNHQRRLWIGLVILVCCIGGWVIYLQTRILDASIKKQTNAKYEINVQVAPVNVVVSVNDEEECGFLENYPLGCAELKQFPTNFNGECNFNLYSDRMYLPDPKYLRCVRKSPRLMWKNDVREYETKVRNLQFQENCSDPVYYANDNNNNNNNNVKKRWHLVRHTSHGHGANQFIMTWLVGNHWDREIPVIATTSLYRFSDSSCGTGWSCHLSPLSNCVLDQADLDLSKVVNYYERLPNQAMKMSEWCKPLGTFNVKYGRCECSLGSYPTNHHESTGCALANYTGFQDARKWKPRFFHHDSIKKRYLSSLSLHWINSAPGEVYPMANRGDPSCSRFDKDPKLHVEDSPELKKKSLKETYGWFWWWSQVNWILHKSAPKRKEVQKRAENQAGMDFSVPCIALHIRRGDACADRTAPHRSCPDFSVYLDGVRNISRLYGPIKQVYLATDDAVAVQEAEEQGKDFQWRYLPIDRKKYSIGDIDNNEKINDPATLDELYTDLVAMSHCDAFVGSMSSSVVWILYGMMIGEKQYYPPFISVDLPWGHKRLGAIHVIDNIYDNS